VDPYQTQGKEESIRKF